MSDASTFATCTYQEFDPSYGIPVRTTVGYPRFRLRYDLAADWKQAAPERAYLHAPKEIFREQYFAKLDRTGPDQFRAMAVRIEDKTQRIGQPVVLLCFDKLWLPDTWCHRTMFAEWWEEMTGEAVPEFGRTKHSDRRPIAIPEGLW